MDVLMLFHLCLIVISFPSTNIPRLWIALMWVANRVSRQKKRVWKENGATIENLSTHVNHGFMLCLCVRPSLHPCASSFFSSGPS